MKLQIKIREVAKGRGIKTAYQLQRRADLAPSTAARLYKNIVSQITLETLDKLCETLDCDAGDLFVRPKKASRSKVKTST
jgi:DNA-binding Xre family transcriptional regulator